MSGQDVQTDAIIVGGGIAGLWLANVLRLRGYRVVVLEQDRLGAGQTLASQGMIHGGLKYALRGQLTRASEAIATMPDRWRSCLDGKGDVDLSALAPLAERYYLFADASGLGKLTGFFASRSLRGRIERIEPPSYPPVFKAPGFQGVVYGLNDFVLDTAALLSQLSETLKGCVFQHAVAGEDLRVEANRVVLRLPDASLTGKNLIICAGAGSQRLLDGLGLPKPRMQLRPLHQVVVRHDHPDPMYAHCLTGIRRPEPRLTITSHPDGDRWLWYLGGQLATDGVQLDAPDLIDRARRELGACVPWLSWDDAQFETLRVDRAEPEQTRGGRPDEAFAAATGSCVVCWPTKLSLVPNLGDKVLPLLSPPTNTPADVPNLRLPPARVGRSPWEA
ncbi:MAG: FAD-dependent oxidoreductase [Pseudomonadales bacterium]|nr:FAD-dependent oxidoreductase [Pseudomonadales bacterium]NIX07097.1 FAD-dependent oxidoreductase [Pseudomonadales bacterium]